jgi:hypothetical protein
LKTEARDYFLLHSFQTGSEAHHTLPNVMDAMVSFPGRTAAGARSVINRYLISRLRMSGALPPLTIRFYGGTQSQITSKDMDGNVFTYRTAQSEMEKQ